MINYYITDAPTQAITAYTTAMKPFGMTFLPDVSDFYTGSSRFPCRCRQGVRHQRSGSADYRLRLHACRPIPGWWDTTFRTSLPSPVQPETFHQYSLIKADRSFGLQPCGARPPARLPLWKDTMDVLGVDPYPLIDASGNDLAEVADWTRAAYQAAHGARPVWTVIQFFQLTTLSPHGRRSSNCTI